MNSALYFWRGKQHPGARLPLIKNDFCSIIYSDLLLGGLAYRLTFYHCTIKTNVMSTKKSRIVKAILLNAIAIVLYYVQSCAQHNVTQLPKHSTEIISGGFLAKSILQNKTDATRRPLKDKADS